MTFMRTEQIHFNDDSLIEFHKASKNLYNEGLYKIKRILNYRNYRQMYYYSNFMKTTDLNNNPNKWLRYNQLDKILQSSKNYKALPAATSQHILKILDKDMKSFYESIKEYSKNPDKFLGRPKLPKYKPKDGEYLLIFTNQQCKIKDGYLLFPKMIPLKIKTRLNDDIDLREIRIIPTTIGYNCEIVYKKIDEYGLINSRWYSRKTNINRIISIDVGVNPFVTIVNNINLLPFTILGGNIKSVNQFYNKELAKLQSIYDKQKLKSGIKKDKLIDKRNKKIKYLMHVGSKYLLDYAIENNIGNVVIGHNEGWKQDVNLGTKVNQEFTQIPFNLFFNMLKYKMEEKGINVVINEESYTSKCSFLDGEEICKHDEYMGKRVKRGLFKSKEGVLIQADVNGAYNIMKKAFPNAFANGIEGVGRHPRRLNIFKQKKPSSKENLNGNSYLYKGENNSPVRTKSEQKIDIGEVRSKSELP